MQTKLRMIDAVHFVAISILVLVSTVAAAEAITFPKGVATPPETCGECHQAIYREYVLGVGSDNHVPYAANRPEQAGKLSLPANTSSTATAHANSDFHITESGSWGDPFCVSCHFPEPFAISDMDKATKFRAKAATGGKTMTCASCHLTPDGKIRGVGTTSIAPHEVVSDPALQTSAMCAHCHTDDHTDRRVVGKWLQTFNEWQEDFAKPGLGKQQCQDCHMPRTIRKVAEGFDSKPRAVARHLWTGANSRQRHLGSLTLSIIQPVAGKSDLAFNVTNIGAGHSVPTTAEPRAVFLLAEIADKKGFNKARKVWMFALNHSDRPDDKAFLEEDKKLPVGEAAAQARADAQGPHEAAIRAGEERVLPWEPALEPGEYIVTAKLYYTIDRFNNNPVNDSNAEIGRATLIIATR